MQIAACSIPSSNDIYIYALLVKTLIYPIIAFKDFSLDTNYPAKIKVLFLYVGATSADVYAHKNRNVVYSVCCYKGWSVIVEDEGKKKVYQRRRYLALRKIDVIAATVVLQIQRSEIATEPWLNAKDITPSFIMLTMPPRSAGPLKLRERIIAWNKQGYPSNSHIFIVRNRAIFRKRSRLWYRDN